MMPSGPRAARDAEDHRACLIIKKGRSEIGRPVNVAVFYYYYFIISYTALSYSEFNINVPLAVRFTTVAIGMRKAESSEYRRFDSDLH